MPDVTIIAELLSHTGALGLIGYLLLVKMKNEREDRKADREAHVELEKERNAHLKSIGDGLLLVRQENEQAHDAIVDSLDALKEAVHAAREAA